MESKSQRVEHFLNIISCLGYKLDKQATILDFGCGNGDIVHEYAKLGYKSFGCDLSFKEGANVAKLLERGVIRVVNQDNYKLPFDDDYFDFVTSDQVFEHVVDYSTALAEIKRVLKPSGICLHIFPSRYKLIEPHVFVPFSGIFQNRLWLTLWAMLGVRKSDQKGMPISDVVAMNAEYLQSKTNYLTKTEITNHVSKYFSSIIYCEREFLKYSKRGYSAYWLSRFFHFLPDIYSSLFSRVLLCKD